MKNNLRLLALALGMGVAMPTLAQKDNVGIGTTKPDQSAVLDINSTNKGLLIPRMSLQQRSAIQTPAQGLMVYQSDFLSGFYFFDGTQWKPMASGNENNSVAGIDGDWDLNGNAITPANFIGSNAGAGINPINFRVNGSKVGSLGTTTSLFLGYLAGNTTTGGLNTGLGYQSLLNNTTGSGNTAVGAVALESNISGTNNFAMGAAALNKNTSGGSNVAIGYSALYNNNGDFNTAIGFNALQNNSNGGSNIAIGTGALDANVNGSNNVSIGSRAGLSSLGSGNLFIGYQAGYSEIGSDKLYIANSSSVNPLIKGDFAASTLKVNSKTAGFLAVGDFDAVTPMPTPAGYRLIVQEGILTEKVKVALRTSATDWADYVFAKDYKLMPLESVEQFTKVNNHLPNVPSADEMVKSGLDVAQTSKMFMEKIEELTLYMIEMNKEIKALKAENAKLKK